MRRYGVFLTTLNGSNRDLWIGYGAIQSDKDVDYNFGSDDINRAFKICQEMTNANKDYNGVYEVREKNNG